MALETKPFDVAYYLTDEETIACYLAEALDSNDPAEIAQAHQDIEHARQRTKSENTATPAPSPGHKHTDRS
jgi:DNA-binding phage protein